MILRQVDIDVMCGFKEWKTTVTLIFPVTAGGFAGFLAGLIY